MGDDTGLNDDRAENFLRMIRHSQDGKLKIYLGYAAGVGKTYQMLLEGRRLKKDGIDVVVGIVETHGRIETEALLNGLELIPRRTITYRGIDMKEMDIDTIIERRPSVVLVDELAHTNVPGSRNVKRYQDVQEILSAGIHVISTLNVQHLESLYETVERATSVKVRERIPDHIVSEADQVVNVDITTEDLRRRLMEGKVYIKDRIETALQHFFAAANLEQLRELTLRELAAQIDSRRRDPKRKSFPPSSPDQVMVCLSSRSPNSDALLRYASRLAGRLNRNWYAVYVQTSKENPTIIDSETQRILSNTLTLAQELGATVFTYKGDDIVKTILQFAREYRVGHIVTGSPGKKVPFFRRLKGEVSMMERLITEGKDITVVVVDTKALPDKGASHEGAASVRQLAKRPRARDSRSDENQALFVTGALIWNEPIEKDEAIRQLLSICVNNGKLDTESTLKSLFEREQKGGTFVGEDVSIPHARVSGVRQAIVAIGVGKAGIYDRESGRHVSIMFLLLSPLEQAEVHVSMLALISRRARDDQWRKKMISALTPSDVVWMTQGR
jgi:two-component system sensor histidine kinase KdpD